MEIQYFLRLVSPSTHYHFQRPSWNAYSVSQGTEYLGFLVFRGTQGRNQKAVVVGGYCDAGQLQHLLFVHRHDSAIDDQKAGILGHCGFDPPIQ